MTGADIAKLEAYSAQVPLGHFFGSLTTGIFGAIGPAAAPPSRFPAAVASHPAFTRHFNAKLVAVGMAATRDKHRGMVG